MGTFAEWLKGQDQREDRVGWSARMWESAKIGRISSPTTIIRKMEEFARDAPSEDERNKWNLAALGAREAAEEYRRRPNDEAQPDQHAAAGVQVPLPFPNASSPATVTGPISGENAAVALNVAQPPEGGIPVAFKPPVYAPPAPPETRLARPVQPDPPPAGMPQLDRMERMMAELAAAQAVNHELLTVIAEFLVIKGDQEGLRAALSRALAGESGASYHPALNWSQMWASADHSAAQAAAG